VPKLKKAIELTQKSSYTPAELDANDKYWNAGSVEKTIKSDGLSLEEIECLT